jgi:hypothetical protein
MGGMGSWPERFSRKDEMSFAWYDIIGTIGVGVIVVTYLLLQLGRIKSEQLVFPAKWHWSDSDTDLALLRFQFAVGYS